MDKHINIQKCLTAFAIITQSGKKTDKGYYYKGIWADAMDDGYTVQLFDENSRLSIFFHNKHQLNSPDRKSMELFIRKLYEVANG